MQVIDSKFPLVEEMIHGVLVRDPYRWLEDRSLPETEEWIRKQQHHCDEYFAQCENLPAIRERVREYLDVEVIDQPARVGDRYFYRRRARGQEQGCIYVRDTITKTERLLIDPSTEGPFVSVGIHRISADGSLLAYELKHGGEDRKSIHIVSVETGITLAAGIELGYARGFAFTTDNRGFYYCQETSADVNEHIIFFRLFEQLVVDQIIFRVARTHGSRLTLTADAVRLGAIWVHENASGESVEDFWVAEQNDLIKWHKVFSDRELPFSVILRDGRVFAVSYEDAPNGKLVELNRDGVEMRTIVHEQGTEPRQLVVTPDSVFVSYVDNGRSTIRCWSLHGEELPEVYAMVDGTIQLLPNLGDGSSLFYSRESFAQPPTIFEYVPARTPKVWHQISTCRSSRSVMVRDAVYTSVDGTEIPITIIHGRSSNKENPSAVIMTSYGGFGVPTTPQFSVLVTVLIEYGVTFAFPHIRGGGEFGKRWHEAGRRQQRQTSFDDFLAASEWLYREGIAAPQHVAIFGGSNSGLLVVTAMTQRPDLFRAVLCIAPLLDMVRYEHFNQASKWKEEYGTCNHERDFRALYEYSPYHRIEQEVDYPAVLFVTGDKDDRCSPAHVRKMAARLSNRSTQSQPVLVDYGDQRGHSPALPLQVRIDSLSRRVAFFCRELNLSIIDGGRHKRLVLESWLLLIYFEFVMHFRGFKALNNIVRKEEVRPTRTQKPPRSADLCHAIDLACVFYFKQVMCLQRSAATTVLLRRHGWEAEMVIGAQIVPFRSHAWVEIRGAVVNDKPYMLDIYQVLERC
jgi:prolyl oligopeptidase